MYISNAIVLLIEYLLFLLLYVNDKLLRAIMFYLGVALHCAIWIFLGLGTFSIVMIGGLFLYYNFSFLEFKKSHLNVLSRNKDIPTMDGNFVCSNNHYVGLLLHIWRRVFVV